MTFGADVYVPVLKIKRGEKAALGAIPPTLRSGIIPLLEIIERTSEKEIAKHIQTAFKDLSSAARLYRRCFLDTREIEPDGSSAVEAIFSRASQESIPFTPVTGLSRTADIAPALRHRSHGMALRLTRAEFESGSLGRRIHDFLLQHHLLPEEIDLIADLGSIDCMVEYGVESLARAFLGAIPIQSRWRTLILSACAFPESMGGVSRNGNDRVERTEWNVWRNVFHSTRQQLERLPSFSDCGIQHPSGVEKFDPITMQVSAAIRYALPEHWLLIKGESTRRLPPSQQFPDLASKLVYGELSGDFAGPDHCSGCASMKAAADGAPKLGSLEAWRRLGTIHHLTTVIEGLTSLPWP